MQQTRDDHWMSHRFSTEFAMVQFDAFRADRKAVDAALKIGNMLGGGLDFVRDVAKNEGNPHLTRASCGALGFCPEDWIEHVLALLLTAHRQDIASIVFGLCQNPKAGRKT
jgi:hypothetical protein